MHSSGPGMHAVVRSIASRLHCIPMHGRGGALPPAKSPRRRRGPACPHCLELIAGRAFRAIPPPRCAIGRDEAAGTALAPMRSKPAPPSSRRRTGRRPGSRSVTGGTWRAGTRDEVVSPAVGRGEVWERGTRGPLFPPSVQGRHCSSLPHQDLRHGRARYRGFRSTRPSGRGAGLGRGIAAMCDGRGQRVGIERFVLRRR
jgi:hypothetical protein